MPGNNDVGATIRSWFDTASDTASDLLVGANARQQANDAENAKARVMYEEVERLKRAGNPAAASALIRQARREAPAAAQHIESLGPLGRAQVATRQVTRNVNRAINPVGTWVEEHKGLIITLAVIAGVVTILWVARPALTIAAGAFSRSRY